MLDSCPTPHISAMPGDFAKTVLMPGDPLRSKFIAENYLENPRLVNNIRGVQGYTGTYKGVPVSVMASGMGMPSIGIYAYELFKFYNVENIIRIGSVGSLPAELKLRDIVLAQGACTNSAWAGQYNLRGTYAPIADFGLLRLAADIADEQGVKVHVGNVMSSDPLYEADPESDDKWRRMGVLGIEMEAAALYMEAARTGGKALAICTVSDVYATGESMTAEDRQISLRQMMELALEIAVRA